MVPYPCNVWICLQELARLLYTAVQRGIMDGAKVQSILNVTEQDAFKGKIIITQTNKMWVFLQVMSNFLVRGLQKI